MNRSTKPIQKKAKRLRGTTSAIAILENDHLNRAPKLISHFGGTNNFFCSLFTTRWKKKLDIYEFQACSPH